MSREEMKSIAEGLISLYRETKMPISIGIYPDDRGEDGDILAHMMIGDLRYTLSDGRESIYDINDIVGRSEK